MNRDYFEIITLMFPVYYQLWVVQDYRYFRAISKKCQMQVVNRWIVVLTSGLSVVN